MLLEQQRHPDVEVIGGDSVVREGSVWRFDKLDGEWCSQVRRGGGPSHFLLLRSSKLLSILTWPLVTVIFLLQRWWDSDNIYFRYLVVRAMAADWRHRADDDFDLHRHLQLSPQATSRPLPCPLLILFIIYFLQELILGREFSFECEDGVGGGWD